MGKFIHVIKFSLSCDISHMINFTRLSSFLLFFLFVRRESLEPRLGNARLLIRYRCSQPCECSTCDNCDWSLVAMILEDSYARHTTLRMLLLHCMDTCMTAFLWIELAVPSPCDEAWYWLKYALVTLCNF